MSGGNWKAPTHIRSWDSFESLVNGWIQATRGQRVARIEKHRFVNFKIVDEVPYLQPFIKLNLLDAAVKGFMCGSTFVSRREVSRCEGDPDFVMARDDQVVAPIEVKGKWSIPTDDVVGSYDQSGAGAIKSALHQLYTYMRANRRKFGILTTYDHTWFVYREQHHILTSPNTVAVQETLFVSRGITFNSQ
eukprot:jgi/Hompol1/2694/HPOL_006130-RA